MNKPSFISIFGAALSTCAMAFSAPALADTAFSNSYQSTASQNLVSGTYNISTSMDRSAMISRGASRWVSVSPTASSSQVQSIYAAVNLAESNINSVSTPNVAFNRQATNAKRLSAAKSSTTGGIKLVSSTLGIAGTGSPTLGIAGTGAPTLGIAGTGAPTLGIAGTGAPTLGIAGTGSPSKSFSSSTLGIAGTGAPTLGIAGTGQPTLGIAGTGAPTLGIAGTGAPILGIAGTGAPLTGIAGTGSP